MDWSVITGFDFQVIWRYLPALLTGLWANIMLTVLGFNLLGDGLRDALDPSLNE